MYFGGGTPSILKNKSIISIMNFVNSLPLEKNVEITIEINPDSLKGIEGKEKLKTYKSLGINRISLGTQGFSDYKLKTLRRTHNVKDSLRAIDLIRKEKFYNLALDLIFGTPNETILSLKKDLEILVSIFPEHISSYMLTLEKGSKWFKIENSLNIPKEDIQSEMFYLVSNTLNKKKYEHYEISNYARNNKFSKHNRSYWLDYDYIGVGAGAHSYFKIEDKKNYFGVRYSNETLPKKYIKKILEDNTSYNFIEKITLEKGIREFFMLRLRESTGFREEDFKEKFKIPLPSYSLEKIKLLKEQNYLKKTSTIKLNPKTAYLLSNQIIQDLVPPNTFI